MKGRQSFSVPGSVLAISLFLSILLVPFPGSAQDSDGDGVDDAAEIELGSNPQDAAIKPVIIKEGGDVRVSHGPGNSQSASLTWTGSEFAVAWHDNREGYYHIYLARLSPDGDTLGAEQRISDNAVSSYHASLVWSGSEFGLSWQNGSAYFDWIAGESWINFARLSPQGDGISLYSSGIYISAPSLAWNGNEFALSSCSTDEFLGSPFIYHLTLFTPEGAVTNNIFIGSYPCDYGLGGSYCVRQSLAGTGSEYGMAWAHLSSNDVGPTVYSTIQFRRVSPDPPSIAASLTIGLGGLPLFDNASLAWSGSEYGLSWNDGMDNSISGEIYFARISATGDRIGDDTRITFDTAKSTLPSLAWAGSGYGVAWQEGRDGNKEIYLALVSAGGVKATADERITFDAGASEKPSLVFTGSEFGVAWEDDRDGNYEIYFARFALDSDGDGIADPDEALTLTDPADWDSDDDGLSDGEEVNVLGTDPNNADTDGDGMDDGDEIAVGRDPLTADGPSHPPWSHGGHGINCAGSVAGTEPAAIWQCILIMFIPLAAAAGIRRLMGGRRDQQANRS